MSVIAFDGKWLISDRRAVSHELCAVMNKTFRLAVKSYAGITGGLAQGLAYVDWLRNGGECPKENSPECSTKIVLVTVIDLADGKQQAAITEYESNHVRGIEIEESKWAWGSGREYALGALLHGASAIEAVQIASELSSTCGGGYQGFNVFTGQEIFMKEGGPWSMAKGKKNKKRGRDNDNC